MVFCLDDGARLLEQSATREAPPTLNLPSPVPQTVGPTVASPRPTSPPRSTITARPEHFQMAPPGRGGPVEPERSHRSALPWILAIVLVLGASGVLIAWILTRDRAGDVNEKYPTPSPSASVVARSSPAPSIERAESPTPEQTPIAMPTRPKRDDEVPRATPVPTPTRPKPMFAVLNNISFNGSRITYYPRPSFGQCQADCAGNSGCKGFTWIRPGAYNPGDSAMCYLMSAVTARVPHACCISGVRN